MKCGLLLSAEHSCCVTMKTSKGQGTLPPPRRLFFSRLFVCLFGFFNPDDAHAHRQPMASCGHILQGTSRPVDLQYCPSNLPSDKHLVRLLVRLCLIDHPTTIALPEIAVRDYLLGEPHLFFKWPYLSLKQLDTWGQWGWGCLVIFPLLLAFKLCVSLSDLSLRHNFSFCH